MKSGVLRQRVRLQVNVLGPPQPPLGERMKSWQDWTPDGAATPDIPAEVVPLSGREWIAAGEKQVEVSARVSLRYIPGVVDTMRLVFDDQVYAIKAVLPDATARGHLTLMVGTGVSDGQ